MADARSVTFRLNGAQRPLGDGSLARVLLGLGYSTDQRGIAVAVNGAVIPKRVWSSTRLRGGDDVEIVGAVQGG